MLVLELAPPTTPYGGSQDPESKPTYLPVVGCAETECDNIEKKFQYVDEI